MKKFFYICNGFEDWAQISTTIVNIMRNLALGNCDN
jgi:hypothetical protein